MCRYSISQYKPHFTCFKCRKTFKQFSLDDMLKKEGKLDFYKELMLKPIKQLTKKEVDFLKRVESSFTNRKVKCPQCGELMVDLGLDFKTPPKNDVKKWIIAAGLYKTGKRFYGCGCYSTGMVLLNMVSFKEYLVKIQRQYQRNLLGAQQMTLKENPSKLEAVKHWKKRVFQVEEELIKLKYKTVLNGSTL